jgi:carbonic anhydrase
MESAAYLKSVIGTERTLVITCIECGLDIEHQYSNGDVFQYTLLGNVLNPDDKLQGENIRDFVQFKRCTRIIVAGHHGCKALNYLRKILPENSLNSNVKEFLKVVYADNHGSLLNAKMAERMMVELNVIHQCNALVRMSGIGELVEDGRMSISGVVIDPSGNHKQVYTNGIGYNHFVSMN